MKKNTTIFETILFSTRLFKVKGLRMLPYFIILLTIMFISSCTKDDSKDNEGGSPVGVWQRYDSPNGYNTDIALGNIPGEPSNRVYMCEHPGSPSAGLYKGYINDNIIKWDASHGLPDAEFNGNDGGRTLYYIGVGDAGKYKKGVWTNTCGELKYTPKNVYYRWTTGPSCSIPQGYSLTYNHPDLPSVLTRNQQYGPMAAGSIEIIINSNGSTSNYITLSEPPNGYRRIYTHNIFSYDNMINRCVFDFNEQYSLTYVDQPL